MAEPRRPESGASPAGTGRAGVTAAPQLGPSTDRPGTGASAFASTVVPVPAGLALPGYRLREPELRFGRDNRNAVAADGYSGLIKFGPHDGAERRARGDKTVRAVLVGRADRLEEIRRARAALTQARLGRLHEVFALEFVDEILVPPSAVEAEADTYRRSVQTWLAGSGPYRREVDIAFVLHEGEDAYRLKGRIMSPYFAVKAAFLKAGIPEQSIQYKNLSNREFEIFQKFRLTNILTAAYAKIGGTPWVIQDGSGRGGNAKSARPDITIGVATTAIYPPTSSGALRAGAKALSGDASGQSRSVAGTHLGDAHPERYIGISTIFRENGSFALWETTAPQQDLDSYVASLERSIVTAIQTFEARENRPVERIACHVSGKRAGQRERDAIRRALTQLDGRAILTDLVHVSDEAGLWLFDGRDSTHRPMPGYLVTLAADGRQALMHTNGRGEKGPEGFPTRPLRLGIYDERPEDETAEECLARSLDVYQHLYDLRWMSWRGVRTASVPVSIAYPKSMANLLAYLYAQEQFQVLDILPHLKDKAWFL